MKKIFHTTIVFLLIPSLVLAQIPQYRGNEPAVKPTDLVRVRDALNTEVGQQIGYYIETKVGSLDLEHAKAFTIEKDEVSFVPIKSFSRVLATLCYRQLEDGSEYLFLITYNAEEKAVSLSFPSGQMYVMKTSGVTESANPDFQFQEYDDMNNKVAMYFDSIIAILCFPGFIILRFINSLYLLLFGYLYYVSPVIFYIITFAIFYSIPLWFIIPALLNSDLSLGLILFAVYYYLCLPFM